MKDSSDQRFFREPMVTLPINPHKAASSGKIAAAASQRPRKSTGTMSGGNTITLCVNQLYPNLYEAPNIPTANRLVMKVNSKRAAPNR